MNRELTFTQVRDGIILALKRAYPNAVIRSDKTLQNVNDGEFNVVYVTSREPEKLGNYRLHNVTFDVIYYADQNNATDDMLRVATDLPLLLETITTPSGAKVHPTGDIEPAPQDDGTLHTIVRYQYHVLAHRVHVDEQGNETPCRPDGTLDDTDLMRQLHLHLHREDE